MGRETALQPMRWRTDGWLETLDGEGAPAVAADSPEPEVGEAAATVFHHDFDAAELPDEFQWLRSPHPGRLFSLSERPGFLRLYGCESLGSHFEQALVARRQQAFCFSVSTRLDYAPRNFQQSAGLVLYYNARKYHYCYVTWDADIGRHLRIQSAEACEGGSAFPQRYPLADGPVEIRASVDYDRLRFGYRQGETGAWTWLPLTLDMSWLSDEAGPQALPNFTGTFVGMACQDMSGDRLPADFDAFTYEEAGLPEG